MELKFRKLHGDARIPAYHHPGDAGMDLFSVEECRLEPGAISAVPTGLQVAIPAGYVGLIWDKSGLSLAGIHCLAGVVDAGYRGEIRIVIINLSKQPVVVSKGKKVAQLLVQPILTAGIREVTELDQTTRGEGGFGSTGLS